MLISSSHEMSYMPCCEGQSGRKGGKNYRELSPLKKNNTNNKNQPQNTNRFLINMYLLTRMEHTKTEEQTGLLSQQTHTTLKLSPKFFFFFLS